MSALLLILILFPMLAAGVSFVIGRFGKTARSVFAAAVCAVTLVISVILFNLVIIWLTHICLSLW